MNIDAYLQRINYSGSREPSAQTLRDLQVAHLRSVPFENLSIHAGEPIVINDEALFKKIVEKRRGGFCYEVNGLFAALLRGLGFEVSMLAAGVAKNSRSDGKTPLIVSDLTETDFGPIFDHMTLMVKLTERWLADVGFGDSFLEPLLIDERGEQFQDDQAFKIVELGDDLVLLRRNVGEEWTAQYRFNLEPHEYVDYEEMCRYHQTSPQSHFTRAPLCSLPTEKGRITLSDTKLITTSDSSPIRNEQSLSEEQYEEVLREKFGIVMK